MISFLFYFFAAIAILCAMMTVSRRNPVSSALWLIGTFFALAAIYTLLARRHWAEDRAPAGRSGPAPQAS